MHHRAPGVVLVFLLAANLEIPRNLLEHEARIRAAFTPAERARTQALEARLSSKMSVNDVTAMTRGETAGILMAVMMQYLKSAQEYARDNRKEKRMEAKESLAARDAKLAQDNKKIDAMRSEADARHDHAMTAANWEMALGIVSNAAAACALGATRPHTVQAPAGVAAPIVAPAALRAVAVPTRTPTKAPDAGK
jgi:hypothetical protein